MAWKPDWGISTQYELKELGSQSVVILGNTNWLDIRTWDNPTFLGFFSSKFLNSLLAYLKFSHHPLVMMLIASSDDVRLFLFVLCVLRHSLNSC